MISKRQIKDINALKLKKNRQNLGQFVVEGVKVVNEFLQGKFTVQAVYALPEYFEQHGHLIENGVQKVEINANELERISFQKSPNQVLAVCQMPDVRPQVEDKGLVVALDDVRDPGNLGTIVRMADWFGVAQVWCSEQCVDVFNPKTLQSTMGSLNRVEVVYTDLSIALRESKLPIFGAFMDGENVYSSELPKEAVLLMGNEANGVSPELESLVGERIAIPRFGELQQTESLNVAMATSILLSEFRSRSLK